MAAYYNEIDPYAAQWLRNLIDNGLIAGGDVDARSIEEVSSSDLTPYTQCHFFAGIGGWSYALELAAWADTVPVWTGSCPCQPFSVVGKREGVSSAKHLWPEFFRLIQECRPPVVFGEQVASLDGLQWIDSVQSDLENAGYAFGKSDTCAAGVGAPHIRQRLYWVGDANCERSQRSSGDGNDKHQPGWDDPQPARHSSSTGRTGYWADPEWIACKDSRYRPIEPGTFPMAYGIPTRVGRVRAYGNAIVPQQAAYFIQAYMQCAPAQNRH